MTKGHDDTSEKNNRSAQNTSEPKAYSFSGKVILGIGLVLAAAAGATMAAMSISVSPSIHLPKTVVLGVGGIATSSSSSTNSLATAAVAQKEPNLNQHFDKRFVLIQNDFGWNGTTGGPAIVVNKGEVVQIVVINAGRMAHNFGIAEPSGQTSTILKQTQNMPLPDRVKNIPYNVMATMPCPGCHPVFEQGHIKQFLQPDTQQVTTFVANKAGNFKYFCMVRGHLWLGMVGDLIVEDNASNGPASSVTKVGAPAQGDGSMGASKGV
ncbi:MAG TPA: hypothetical protein VJ729_06200 [Nitrososphaeraceae archaeon]|nr:hypothetical protein [Nitrososphaeraceae archaeon]